MHEADDFRRILASLGNAQHRDLAAHLYSAYLLHRQYGSTGRGIPHRRWTAWPQRDAPRPDIPFDEVEDSPSCGTLPPAQPESAESLLVRAAEGVYQRIVYRRLHAAGLQPDTRENPRIGALARRVLALVERRLVVAPPSTIADRRARISWEDLHLSPRARRRMERMFERGQPRVQVSMPPEPVPARVMGLARAEAKVRAQAAAARAASGPRVSRYGVAYGWHRRSATASAESDGASAGVSGADSSANEAASASPADSSVFSRSAEGSVGPEIETSEMGGSDRGESDGSADSESDSDGSDLSESSERPNNA